MNFAFINDLPEINLSADEKPSASWVQIAKIGNYQDPRYGKFSITESDFDSWIKNFNRVYKAEDRLGAPIDIDHGPEKTGNTEAAGWVTAIEKRGKELWAKAQWNTLGVDLISDKRYAYLSPSYTDHYRDEEGKDLGKHIVGVGLTNRPFLTMATVSLCEADPEFAHEIPGGPDSPVHMETPLSKIALAMGLSEDADEATILAAVAKGDDPTDKTLDAQAKAEGKVVLAADAVLALTAKAERGDAAASELALMKFESAFTLAVDEGRKTPAEKDDYLKLYEVAPEATLDAIKNAPKVLNTTLAGSSAGGGETAPGVTSKHLSDATSGGMDNFDIDTERAELDTKVQSLMREHNVDYGKALDMALAGSEA